MSQDLYEGKLSTGKSADDFRQRKGTKTRNIVDRDKVNVWRGKERTEGNGEM